MIKQTNWVILKVHQQNNDSLKRQKDKPSDRQMNKQVNNILTN